MESVEAKYSAASTSRWQSLPARACSMTPTRSSPTRSTPALSMTCTPVLRCGPGALDEGASMTAKLRRALEEVGDAPCSGCKYESACAAGLACKDFRAWVHSGRSNGGDRIPNAEVYAKFLGNFPRSGCCSRSWTLRSMSRHDRARVAHRSSKNRCQRLPRSCLGRNVARASGRPRL